jgi:ribonuclease HI/pyruvate/2-oxoglutarate dehydrogenase complex dihydrolipoamide acyltransferase (E2) component
VPVDWLFGVPRADLDSQERVAAEQLAADPAAAAIPDDEAELFFCAAYVVSNLPAHTTEELARAFGVRLSHAGPKGHRRAVLQTLRLWGKPKVRNFLINLVPNVFMGPYPDVNERGHLWTEELFAEAFHGGWNIVWLVHVRRLLGKADTLTEWMSSLHEVAPAHFQLSLNYSRLTLRRLVYPEAEAERAQQQSAAAAAPAATLAELRVKDRQTGTLRQDLRRLEQDRKRLKERARRAELEARAMLSQARGEVEAARKSLRALRAAQERELADQDRRFKAQVASLREQLAAVTAAFAQSLSHALDRASAPIMQGRTVTVAGGRPEEAEIHRLLVESLGALLVPEGGDVTLQAAGSFAAFERQLRSHALQQVLIKCDGLFRRKEERPGIAVSAFQVHAGGEAIYADGRVVCCGPLAGSLQAEYGAATLALKWLQEVAPAPGARVEVWIDCRPLVGRLARHTPARRKAGCVLLDTAARRLIRELRSRGFELRLRWVPRAEVHAVDRLCDLTYREARWYHRRRAQSYSAPLKGFLQSAGL